METRTGIEYDQLTGLYSRWHCILELQKILASGEHRVYGSVDLDNFKRINVRYGNNKGDELLKVIANALVQCFPDAKIFRLSGDEYAFILPPVTYNRHEMSLLTRKVFDNLHNVQVSGLENEQLSFSIGSVFIDNRIHHSPDDIILEAVTNRHNAKKHEGNFLFSKYGSIPDVTGCFIALREDRNLYNNLNNRLFSIRNEEDWMSYLHESSDLKENMCRRNQGRIDDILNYYKQGDLPEIEYDLLFYLVVNYVEWLDAFMYGMLIDNILIPYYESQPKTDKVRSYLGHLYLMMGDSMISIYRMGDLTVRKRINSLFKKSCEITCNLPHNSVRFEPYFFSLCEMVGHYENLDQVFGSIDECDQCYEELRELLLGDDPIVFQEPDVLKHFEYLVNNARLFPIYRTCYLLIRKNKFTEEEKEEFKRRIDYIKSHLDNEGVFDMAGNDPTIRRMAKFLQSIILFNISKEEILGRLMNALHEVHMIEYGKLSQSNIVIVAYMFLGASQALLIADISDAEKSRIGRLGVEFLIEILRNRESIATDHQVLFLTQVLIRAMLSTNVLTPAEKYHYLKDTMAAITIDTYGHSKAVATYANIILANIIDNYPNLLVGPNKMYSSIEELKANRDNLLVFMESACILHDTGKMSITPITSNAYRRLTDKEFNLIRRHPAAGVSILRLEPAFDIFHPFVYGHHRWWNGEAGYPAVDFKEEQSRFKVLVDILSICDSLEAATSHIGRNYRNAKTFLQILDEFYVESGTRYNKDVIQSIISNPDTYYEIRQMVDHNWQHVYQHIYQELIADGSVDNQNPSVSDLPDPFKNSSKANDVVLAESLSDLLNIPSWLRGLDYDSHLLYTFSLMKFNQMNVINDKCIIFYYIVSTDHLGLSYYDPHNSQKAGRLFTNHFSEKPLNLFLSQEGYEKAIRIIRRVIDEPDFPKEGQQTLEYNDKSLCLLATYSSVVDNKGNVLSIIGRLQNINTTSEKYLKTIKTQNRYLSIFSALSDMYVTAIYTDINFNEFELIKSFPALEQGAKSASTTRELSKFVCEKIVDPMYREEFMAFVNADTIPERLKDKKKLTFEYKSHFSGWLRAHIIPAGYDDRFNITHYLFLAESFEEEHEKQRFLTYAANYDSLTGLMNRNFGEKVIKDEILKGGSQIFAILDCDNFKTINDQLSHLAGDSVLRGQGRILREFFANNKCMRLGGDEFVAYINGDNANIILNDYNGLQNFFGQVAKNLSTLHLPELENIAPTMSIGVVYSDGSDENITFDKLYNIADSALHESKKRRNGSITYYPYSNKQLFV